jgi:hypothetical protein
MKKYEVVMSESVVKWVEVEANNEDEAIKKVKEDCIQIFDITNEECLDRSIESVEEVE